MAYAKEVSNKLNKLLEKNYDAEASYKAAAGNVKNSKLKTYFQNKAEDRYAFGHELKEEIKLHGDTPEKETSFKGDAHRTWMNLKSTFSGNKEEAILEETIGGEKAFAEDYDDVLKETTLAVSTKKLIENQRNKVRNSLEEVKTMESFA